MEKDSVEKFKGFFSRMKKTDEVALIYHRDADGFCSGVITAIAVERLFGKKPVLLLDENYDLLDAKPAFFSKLKNKNVTKTIIVDVNVDENPVVVKSLEKFSDVLVLDHHQMFCDLSSEKTVFLKAQFLKKIDSSRYPASKMCFDLFSEIVNVSDLDWVAAVGILGDCALLNWQDFLDQTISKGNYSLREMKKLKDLIEAVCLFSRQKIPLLFKEFCSAKRPRDLDKSKFWKILQTMEEKVNSIVGSVNEKAEFFPDLELVWFEIKSNYPMKSPVINRISHELFPNQTVFVVEDTGKKTIGFSARRQDFKVKMNELLAKATTGISGASGGGHIPAAAGKVPREQIKEFKQNVLSLLQDAMEQKA